MIFSNIVKKLIAGIIQVSCSPVAICLGFATVIATVITKFTTWFDSFKFENNFTLDIDYSDELMQLVLYCMNWNELQSIFACSYGFYFLKPCHFVVILVYPFYLRLFLHLFFVYYENL